MDPFSFSPVSFQSGNSTSPTSIASYSPGVEFYDVDHIDQDIVLPDDYFNDEFDSDSDDNINGNTNTLERLRKLHHNGSNSSNKNKTCQNCQNNFYIRSPCCDKKNMLYSLL